MYPSRRECILYNKMMNMDYEYNAIELSSYVLARVRFFLVIPIMMIIDCKRKKNTEENDALWCLYFLDSLFSWQVHIISLMNACKLQGNFKEYTNWSSSENKISTLGTPVFIKIHIYNKYNKYNCILGFYLWNVSHSPLNFIKNAQNPRNNI